MRKLFTILVMLVAVNAIGQWQADVRLTNDADSSLTSRNNARCIAVYGNVVHTVWTETRDGNPEIYYKRSTDGGTSWETDKRLTNNPSLSTNPSIAVSASYVHIVWIDTRNSNPEVYYKRSTDGGINWGLDTRLTNKTGNSEYPSVTVAASVVRIVWSDNRDGNYEIYSKHSTDGGAGWTLDERITNNINESYQASVAVSGSFEYIVWQDSRDGNYEIYYKRSTNSGTNWSAETRLTNNANASMFPSVSFSGQRVFVVWSESRDGNKEIYCKYSTDGGTNWGAETRLTNNPDNSSSPFVIVSTSFVHIIWQDNRDGNYEIYYKRSTDGGTSWSADTRLTNNSSYSSNPSIALSGAFVHIIWYDVRDGNCEIYYKRNPTGNVGIQSISTEVPTAYSLSQNYPNPFNPITNVKFSIVNSGEVKLVVYDIMGREIQTLVNERLQPGTYEATFDGNTLNSGVYFYKLITDGFTETKRMLLIK